MAQRPKTCDQCRCQQAPAQTFYTLTIDGQKQTYCKECYNKKYVEAMTKPLQFLKEDQD